MKPFLILVVFPVMIGFLSELVFRDARKASFAAVVGATAVTCISVQILEPRAAWNWLAAIMVSPITIAIAVTVALYFYSHIGTLPRTVCRDS